MELQKLLNLSPQKVSVNKLVARNIGLLIIFFLLLSVPGKAMGKDSVLLYSKKIRNTPADDIILTEYLNRAEFLASLSKNDSLSCYAFYINELNEKDEYIKIQKSLISRQKSHLLILFFLFLMTMFSVLFSIVFYRHRYEKLATLYKEHSRLSVSKGLNYYQKNDKQLVLTGEQEKFRRIYNGVLRLFDKEKIYLDPGLTIRGIAQQLYTNEKYVSKAVNLCAEMNFSNFLNKYRVNEAINYMRTPLYDPLSLEQIMERSGFYSRSTFTSAFKNSTGMSPGQYRNQFPEAKVIEMPASAG